jgi:hypothetical protein
MAKAYPIKLIPLVKDVKSVEDARNILVKISQEDRFTKKGVERLVSIHRHMTAMAFSEQVDPDTGDQWAKESYKTGKDARWSGHLLIRSSTLLKAALSPDVSISGKRGEKTATVKMPSEPFYAEFHQFGTNNIRTGNGGDVFINNKTKSVETVYRRGTRTPARPFFAFARDNFSSSEASKLVDKTLQVVFESISNSFLKRAIQLPAEEIEGYQAVVSFSNFQPMRSKHGGPKGAHVHISSKTGREITIRTGVKSYGKRWREGGMRFDYARTQARRPPIIVKKGPRRGKTEYYLQLKKNYELKRRETRFDTRKQYKEMLAGIEKRASIELSRRVNEVKTRYAEIALDRSLTATEAEAERLKVRLQMQTDKYIYYKNVREGTIDIERTIARTRERLALVEARAIRETAREAARKAVGFKSPGRHADSAEARAAKETARKEKRRARSAKRAELRAAAKKQRMETVNRILTGEDKATLITDSDTIKAFYQAVKHTNLQAAEAQYHKAQAAYKAGNSQVSADTLNRHSAGFRKAQTRVEDFVKRLKAQHERGIRAAEEAQAAADKEAKKATLSAQAEADRLLREAQKEQAAENKRQREQDAELKRQHTELVKKGMRNDLNAVEKKHNATINKEVAELRKAKTALLKGGNIAAAEHYNDLINEKRSHLIFRSSDPSKQMSAAQLRATPRFKARIDQLRATSKRLKEAQIQNTERIREVRRSGDLYKLTIYNKRAAAISKLRERINKVHIPLLTSRFTSLEHVIAPATPMPKISKVTVVPKPGTKAPAKVKKPPKPKK